jgi:RimJ/RimL family protein N-acetyltransferase
LTGLVFGHDETIAEWVGKKVGKPFHKPYTAFGVIDEQGTLTGGFVFTGYNGDGIEMSLAGKGCVTRGAMCAVLDYVFRQQGCKRLQVHTRRSNKQVCRLLRRLCGQEGYEGIARKFYGDEDGIVYALTTPEKFRERWKLR